MKNINEVRTFNEYWTHYLSAHSNGTSRALHFGGLVLSAASAVWLIAHGLIFFLVLAAVPAMIGAWLGHRLSPRKEHVLDDIVDEHPEWAVRADLKMFALAITGRLGSELARVRDIALPSRPALSH